MTRLTNLHICDDGQNTTISSLTFLSICVGPQVLTEREVEGWDAVLLVQYPRRSAFKAFIDDPNYQDAFESGKSGLVDIVLQPLKHCDALG